MSLEYKKLYTLWKGQNYFLCDGKALTGGQNIKPMIFTSVLMSVPIIFFFSFHGKVFLI